MKVSELIGAQLDWAVAKAQGWIDYPDDSIERGSKWHCDPNKAPFGRVMRKQHFTPSTDWAQGGPIIEQKKYEFVWLPRQQEWYVVRKQHGTDGYITDSGFGPTLLVAAMRCYVTSEMGSEVDIPEELA